MIVSNDLIIGWCAASSFLAMADKKYWWSAWFLVLAAAAAVWR